MLQTAAQFQADVGDVAIVYSRYQVETEVGGKRKLSPGRVTEVFVRRHGKWINPGWHTDEEPE